MYDVVVVGGGAGGLNAALVLGRARRRVAVVDSGAPWNAPAVHMQGFLSRDGMSPAELLAAGRVEVAGYGVELVDDQVVAIKAGFIVQLAGGRGLRARRILVATGVHDELPEIPGVRERWGRDLLHCPYCHGWEVRDQPLGVLGTMRGSVQHAQLVRQWSNDVAFFVHTYELTAAEHAQLEARGMQIIRGEVARQAPLLWTRSRGAGVRELEAPLRTRTVARPWPRPRPASRRPLHPRPPRPCTLARTTYPTRRGATASKVPRLDEGEHPEEQPGQEALAARADRILRFELSENPYARAVFESRDLTEMGITPEDGILFALRYGNALREALLGLAEQVDARLARPDS